jgi:hypothetical protein
VDALHHARLKGMDMTLRIRNPSGCKETRSDA